jgi:hypothetical protein
MQNFIMLPADDPGVILLEPKRQGTAGINLGIVSTRLQTDMLQLLRRQGISGETGLLRIVLDHEICLAVSRLAEMGYQPVDLAGREDQALGAAAVGVHLDDAAQRHQRVLPDHVQEGGEGGDGEEGYDGHGGGVEEGTASCGAAERGEAGEGEQAGEGEDQRHVAVGEVGGGPAEEGLGVEQAQVDPGVVAQGAVDVDEGF